MISNSLSNNSNLFFSNKRSRALNDAEEPLYQKLKKTDYTNVGATRKLLLEANKIDLVDALHYSSQEDQATLHSINTFAYNNFNLANRDERLLNRLVNQYPDCATMDQFLNPNDVKSMQKYIDKEYPEEDLDQKTTIVFCKATISMNPSKPIEVTLSNKTYEEDVETNKEWITNIFKRAMEASFQLDGENAFGTFKGRLYIVRDTHSETNDEPEVLPNLHHDVSFSKDSNPKKLADYLCLSVLSDKSGNKGWEGGDLIVQNNVYYSNKLYFNNFDPSKKYVKYSYPPNQAICLRNLEVVHQRTELKGVAIQRDLLNVRLFRLKDI